MRAWHMGPDILILSGGGHSYLLYPIGSLGVGPTISSLHVFTVAIPIYCHANKRLMVLNMLLNAGRR
jgi:hypothetical protein